MKKAFLVFAALVSFSTLSHADGGDPSPYYIKELRSLVRTAPTAHAKNVATHYLKLAQASEKIEATTVQFLESDISALRSAFGSDPKLVALINSIESSQTIAQAGK